jgi:hypothetical protein
MATIIDSTVTGTTYEHIENFILYGAEWGNGYDYAKEDECECLYNAPCNAQIHQPADRESSYPCITLDCQVLTFTVNAEGEKGPYLDTIEDVIAIELQELSPSRIRILGTCEDIPIATRALQELRAEIERHWPPQATSTTTPPEPSAAQSRPAADILLVTANETEASAVRGLFSG